MSLPLLPIRLIGREQQLEQLDQLLRSHRFVTLTGTGGVGKTALAIEVARIASVRFHRGAAFVPLASTRDPALVLPQIARHCGAPEPGMIWSPELLAHHIGDQSRLLLLDNLEQVQSSAIHFSELASLCPNLTILVTSRTRLNLRVEQVFTIPPLDLGDAHTQSLFRDLGDRGGMVNCLTELAMVAAQTGRLTVAARRPASSVRSTAQSSAYRH